MHTKTEHREVLLFEFLIVVLAVFVIVRLTNQADQIKALQAEVRALKQKLSPLFPERKPDGFAQEDEQDLRQTGWPPPSREAAPASPDPTPDPEPVSSAVASTRWAEDRAETPVREQRPSPSPHRPPSPASGRSEPLIPRLSAQTRQEWEALVGERLLNRVGAIALIIASGLFLKYAFDRDWISPTLRVLIGAATGCGLIFAASRQRERLPVFAQGLLGTGLSILYLSVYASFAFYELIAVPIAFVLMSVVTATAFERAVRFDSQGVGLLGWAGGYLTPLLLSNPMTGSPGGEDPAPLFIYLLLLQAGLLGLAAWKPQRWGLLFGLTLGGTYVTYLMWHTTNYGPGHFWAALAFLFTAWAMFVAIDLRRLGEEEQADDSSQGVLSWINGVVFYGLVYGLVASRFPDWLPAMTLVVAAAYAAPIFAFRRAIPPYAWRSIALLAIATRLQFTGMVPAVLWAVEALMLLLAGLKLRLQHVRVAALALYAFAVAGLLAAPDALVFRSLDQYSPVANERALAFALIAALLAAGAVFINRFYEGPKEDVRFGPDTSERDWAVPALHYAWAGVLFGLLTVEINDFFRWRSNGRLTGSVAFVNLLSMAAVWGAYSILLVRQGVARRSSALVYTGTGIIVLATLVAGFRGAAFVPITEFQPLFNVRAVVIALVAACLYLNWRTVKESDEDWAGEIAAGMAAGAAGLIFVLITGEIRDLYRRSMMVADPPDLDGLRSQLQLALSAGWLFYASVGLSLGFWLKKPGMRIAAIGLLGLTVLKVFLFDLSFLDQLYRIFSFMALGIILMAASYLYQRYREAIFGAG